MEYTERMEGIVFISQSSEIEGDKLALGSCYIAARAGRW